MMDTSRIKSSNSASKKNAATILGKIVRKGL